MIGDQRDAGERCARPPISFAPAHAAVSPQMASAPGSGVSASGVIKKATCWPS